MPAATRPLVGWVLAFAMLSQGCGTFVGIGVGSMVPRYENVPGAAQDAVPRGSTLRITTRDETSSGELVRSDPETLYLRQDDGRTRAIDRALVERAERKTSDGHWLDGLLVGTGVDVVTGAILYALVFSKFGERAPMVARY
jgi:hypothetical protein